MLDYHVVSLSIICYSMETAWEGLPLSGVCKVTAAVEIGLSSIDVVIFIDPSFVKAFLRFKSISNWYDSYGGFYACKDQGCLN